MSMNNTNNAPGKGEASAGNPPLTPKAPSWSVPPAGLKSPPGWADALATVASPGPIDATTSTTNSKTTSILAGQKRPAPGTPSSAPGTPGTPSKSGKKRPYRRTKRPAGYNDRSTVTTVTPKAAEGSASINEYDLVLAESEDLLNASLQAQKLGRLKMASAYQLLLHTRLVGMGKRVDRSTLGGPVAARQLHHRGSVEGNDSNPQDSKRPSMGSRLAAATAANDESKPGAKTGKEKSSDKDNSNSNAEPAPPPESKEKQMLKQLSTILPQDAEMDASMMEHLARAAAELHHQRTGRRRTTEGLLALTNPLNPLAAMTNKPQAAAAASVAAAAATTTMTTATKANPSSKPPLSRRGAAVRTAAAAAAPAKTTVSAAWTAAEIDIVNKGVTKKWQPETIAKILSNKNEEQIRAFLATRSDTMNSNNQATTVAPKAVAPPPVKLSAARNKKEPTRSVPNAAGGGASASNSTKAAAASIAQNITGDAVLSSASAAAGVDALFRNPAGAAPVVPEVVAASVVGGIPLDAASPSRSKTGGRGRKPATTAMNTVATVSLDVKSLLQSNTNNQGGGNK